MLLKLIGAFDSTGINRSGYLFSIRFIKNNYGRRAVKYFKSCLVCDCNRWKLAKGGLKNKKEIHNCILDLAKSTITEK